MFDITWPYSEIIFETSGEERNFNFFLNFSFVCL